MREPLKLVKISTRLRGSENDTNLQQTRLHRELTYLPQYEHVPENHLQPKALCRATDGNNPKYSDPLHNKYGYRNLYVPWSTFSGQSDNSEPDAVPLRICSLPTSCSCLPSYRAPPNDYEYIMRLQIYCSTNEMKKQYYVNKKRNAPAKAGAE